MSTASEAKLGFDPARLARVEEALRQDIETGFIHGAAMRVSRRGETILNFVGGYADKTADKPLQKDSVFVTMSTGKPFTVVLVLSLVERGLLRLHSPIADIIPEFGKFGKESVNLFHLLTHTSGILGSVPSADPAVLSSIERLTDYACNLPLDCLPGERVNYSMVVAHSVLATMCLRVDGRGRSFAQMLEEDLFHPLGMRDTSLGPREDLMPRLCPVRASQEVPYNLLPGDLVEFLAHGIMLAPGAELPAGGYITTIDDLHRFAEMLRHGGALDDTRILSPAMLRLSTRNYTGSFRNAVWDPILSVRGWQPWPAYIGLGFRLRGEGLSPGPFGMMNSAETFGHFGAGSSGFWIDPASDLSFSLLTTGLIEESHNLERTAKLADLVMSALIG